MDGLAPRSPEGGPPTTTVMRNRAALRRLRLNALTLPSAPGGPAARVPACFAIPGEDGRATDRVNHFLNLNPIGRRRTWASNP